MAFVPGYRITVGRLVFDYVADVEIKHSWNELTDTAIITLPRGLKLKNKAQRLDELIKSGDKVRIELGYLPKFTLEFEGYVARIKPGVPVVLECEDETYMLRRSNYTKGWESVKLKEVISFIAPGYKTDVLDADLGAFRINKANACKVLDFIKDTYGISSFFRGKTLVVGFPYPNEAKKVKYSFNGPNGNIAESDLQFRKKEDVRLLVKAISKMPDNKEISVEIGDDGGDVRTLHVGYNIPKSELKRRAESEIDKIKVDGYTGSITGFGIPYAEHGDIAVLYDDEYPERQGEYYIDAVTITAGINGYRRICEIGKRAI